MDQEEALKIVEASSSVITEPMELDSEALKAHPAPIPEATMAQRLASAPPTSDVMSAPKRRGRPAGSKNKSTIARENATQINRGARMVIPPGKKAKEDDGLTADQRREAKLTRADKLATTVSDTINDNLMLLLMSLGMPSELLYMPGKAPKEVKVDEKYTALAKQLTIDPMQAHIIGRFLAEMEATETGGKVGTAISDGKGPLIIYGILSVAAGVQWGKNLMDAYKAFEPMLADFKARQNVAEQQKFNAQQTTGG